MLVEDFDEFMAEPHSARRALHCAITAYHLHDWVWRDWIENDPAVQETLDIRSKRSFIRWINKRCVWFRAVADLANGTKHFIRDQGFETARVAAAPFSFDQLHAGFDQGAWDGPVRYVAGSLPTGPQGKGYLLLDFGEAAGDHRYLTAACLLEVVVRF